MVLTDVLVFRILHSFNSCWIFTGPSPDRLWPLLGRLGLWLCFWENARISRLPEGLVVESLIWTRVFLLSLLLLRKLHSLADDRSGVLFLLRSFIIIVLLNLNFLLEIIFVVTLTWVKLCMLKIWWLLKAWQHVYSLEDPRWQPLIAFRLRRCIVSQHLTVRYYWGKGILLEFAVFSLHIDTFTGTILFLIWLVVVQSVHHSDYIHLSAIDNGFGDWALLQRWPRVQKVGSFGLCWVISRLFQGSYVTPYF